MHIETEETPEGTTVLIHGTIQDHGTPPVSLAASDLTTLTVTIYEKGSRSIIGDWNDKDVLSTGGGSFDVNNVFTLRLAPEDTEPLFPARKREEWIIMFRWSYNAGQDVGHQEVSFPLANRPHVPATS
jgi:hypothetical protein